MPLLAAAALTAADTADLRCMARLAIVASEQRRGTGWRDYPAIDRDGARFTGVVGERIVRERGQTREAVRAAILAEVAAAQKGGELDRGEIDRCAARMRAVAPPPTLTACAAIMAAAYEGVKAREGMSADAKDLATLASVLGYRAREKLTAAGRSGAEADAAMAAARGAAAKDGPPTDDDLADCAPLAAPAR